MVIHWSVVRSGPITLIGSSPLGGVNKLDHPFDVTRLHCKLQTCSSVADHYVMDRVVEQLSQSHVVRLLDRVTLSEVERLIVTLSRDADNVAFFQTDQTSC
jgi:hypothetical protein